MCDNEYLKQQIITSTQRAAEYISKEQYQAAATILSGAYTTALSLPGVQSYEIYSMLQDAKRRLKWK